MNANHMSLLFIKYLPVLKTVIWNKLVVYIFEETPLSCKNDSLKWDQLGFYWKKKGGGLIQKEILGE